MSLCVLIIALLALIRAAGMTLVPLPPDVVSAKKWTNTSLPVSITGFVSESETREEYSYLILKRAVLSVDSHMYELNKVRVTLKNPQHYAVDSFLCAKGILREPEPASNEGQFDRKNYYRMLGIYYTMGNAEIEVLDSRGDPLRETLHGGCHERDARRGQNPYGGRGFGSVQDGRGVAHSCDLGTPHNDDGGGFLLDPVSSCSRSSSRKMGASRDAGSGGT